MKNVKIKLIFSTEKKIFFHIEIDLERQILALLTAIYFYITISQHSLCDQCNKFLLGFRIHKPGETFSQEV